MYDNSKSTVNDFGYEMKKKLVSAAECTEPSEYYLMLITNLIRFNLFNYLFINTFLVQKIPKIPLPSNTTNRNESNEIKTLREEFNLLKKTFEYQNEFLTKELELCKSEIRILKGMLKFTKP